jgi:hypothetical protein
VFVQGMCDVDYMCSEYMWRLTDESKQRQHHSKNKTKYNTHANSQSFTFWLDAANCLHCSFRSPSLFHILVEGPLFVDFSQNH